MNDLLNAIVAAIEPALQYVVVLPRLATLFVVFPLLSVKAFPLRMRAVVLFAFALATAPAIEVPPVPPTPLAMITFCLSEVAIGIFLGVAARVILGTIQAASGLFANQAGFSIANQLDPFTGDTSLVPTSFHALVATTIFFAANFHHLLISTLVRSFRVLPSGHSLASLGQSLDASGAGAALGDLFFDLALSFAAPAMILTITFDLVMLLAGKSMPQAPILLVAYPVKIGVGMLGMIILSNTIGHGLPAIAKAITETPALLR